jgi:DsbC/DsbD-like thiol-disulfide interchange protein
MEKKIWFLLIFLIGVVWTADAQIHKPVVWSYLLKKIDKENGVVYLKATIEDGWHIYGLNGKAEGPTPTKITFIQNHAYALAGKITEPKPTVKFEKVFGFNVNYHENEVVFQQKVKLNSSGSIKGKIEFMACTNQNCLPPDEVNFSVPIK